MAKRLQNSYSEYKIRSNLADDHSNNNQVTGKITIFTERKVYLSCLGVIKQFQNTYPNIEICVIHNNGGVLKPNTGANDVRKNQIPGYKNMVSA
ncbi:hypothetical protein KRX19_02015 [Cardiobacteriaceae bacterium TAE3-ERU3]|nr:hypothetical protein [Cardiobacteriaceae bacterium TAE3-ERU3]